MQKGETGTRHTELTVETQREGRLHAKTMLTVNAITGKACNINQSKSTWNPSARTYQKHYHFTALNVAPC